MADEIRVSASIQVEKGNFKLPRTGGEQLTFDQTGVGGGVPGTVSIGTAEEDVDLSALTTPGWVRLLNIDETNYVDWGPKNSSGNMQALGRLHPGAPALFYLYPGVTLRMKANVAACIVQILAVEA